MKKIMRSFSVSLIATQITLAQTNLVTKYEELRDSDFPLVELSENAYIKTSKYSKIQKTEDSGRFAFDDKRCWFQFKDSAPIRTLIKADEKIVVGGSKKRSLILISGSQWPKSGRWQMELSLKNQFLERLVCQSKISLISENEFLETRPAFPKSQDPIVRQLDDAIVSIFVPVTSKR